MIDRPSIADSRRGYEFCFGCGPKNPMGLQLDGFEVVDDTVVAEFTPRPDYQGFGGVLHGGVLATALDEILAWSAILIAGSPAVTAKLELRYRKPAPADATYRLTGRVLDDRGRRLRLAGTCHIDNRLIAEAEGVFLKSDGSTDYL
jgi:acyl-coenzyme A thioesterase PaaI-like protein